MKREIRLSLVFMSVMLLLASCNSNKNNDAGKVLVEKADNALDITGFINADNSLSYYSAVQWTADIGEDAVFQYALNNTNAYYVVTEMRDEYRTHLYVVDYESLYELSDEIYKVNGMVSNGKIDLMEISTDITPEEFVENNIYISQLYSTESNLYVLSYISYDDGNMEYFMYELDNKGDILQRVDLKSSIKQAHDAGEQTTGMRVLDCLLVQENNDGCYYYLGYYGNNSQIVVINEKGEIIDSSTLGFEILTMSLAENGKIYMVYQENGITRIAAYDITEGINDIGSMNGMSGNEGLYSVGDESGSQLYTNVNGIYMFDMYNHSYSQLAKWTDIGMEGRKISTLNCNFDNELTAVEVPHGDNGMPGFSLIMLKRSQDEYKGEKEKITIGTYYESEIMLDTIRLFNASNSMYEAELVIYEDFEKLGTELLSGKGTDLIDSYMIDLEQYAQAGVIEDLNQYLEREDTMLSEDMLVDAVVQAYTKNGMLTAIPPTFGISCFSGKSALIGEDAALGRDEFFDMLQNNQGINVALPGYYGDSARSIIMMDWMANQEFYVDMENDKAYFDSEEFLQTLQLAATYKAEVYDMNILSPEIQLNEGKSLLYDGGGYISNVADYRTMMNVAGENGIIVGYPSMDGETTFGMTTFEGYAINSNSNKKAAAWAFIEFAVMIQGNSDKDMYSEFPSLRSALEEVFTACQEEDNRYGSVSEEQIEYIRFIIDNVGFIITRNGQIQTIISEEINMMLDGERSPEDTAAIIQNRVMLYLDENAD